MGNVADINYRGISKSGLYLGLLCYCVTLVHSSVVFAQSASPFFNPSSPIASGAGQRLLVKYRSTIKKKPSRNDPGFKLLGVNAITAVKSVAGLHVFSIRASEDIAAVRQKLANDPNIEYVEPDQELFLRKLPGDPRYSELWGLENMGAAGNIDVDVNAEQAWDITTGSQNIVIAVLDTGVVYTHEDIRDNMWRNPNEIPNNNIDDDVNGYIDDIYGIDAGDNDSDPMDNSGVDHGTHVAGIVGAKGNNAIGITGIVWDVSILACKMFTTQDNTKITGLVSSAIECIDYVIDLKINHGTNIVAVNGSWGWTGAYSQALRDAIQRLGDAGILFVTAAGNHSVSNDTLIDYPSTYHLANLLSVSAINSNGQSAFFSNYGKHTVHIAAPGEDILSTVAGTTFPVLATNPHADIFYDGAELGLGDWVVQSPWAIDNTNAYSGTGVWSDSPGLSNPYSNNVNARLQSKIMDLSSFINSDIYLGFFAKFDLEDGVDLVHIELSGDGGNSWVVAAQLTGFSADYSFYEFEIPSSVKTSNFVLSFHITSDATITGAGIYIDDIGIGSGPAVRLDNRYGTMLGTSMAAPYVSGALALLKAQDPIRDWRQLKNLLIAGGKPFANNTTPTISNRYLRLVDVNGEGSMSCENQIVKTRLRPAFDQIELLLGSNETLNIAYLHINCDKPAGELSVRLLETSATIALLDDGLGFDQVAGDGIYSANIDVLNGNLNLINIELPDGDIISVRGKKTYIADDNVVYNWRSLVNATTLVLADDNATEYFSSPFPVNFDDQSPGFSEIGVNENGFMILNPVATARTFTGVIYENNLMPSGSTTAMIAPFWDDLTIQAGKIEWAVLGVAPARELVVQWTGVARVDSTKTGIVPSSQGATFQTVFFENSSDVLFNYEDVVFNSSIGDFGASATIGIQSTQTQGRTYAYNIPLLSNQSAILWRNKLVDNLAPKIALLRNISIVAGQSVSFIVDVSDVNSTRPILTATGIPNGAKIDLSTGQFDWVDGTVPGEYTIGFLATDAIDPLLTSELVSVTISVVENSNPVFESIAAIQRIEGQDIEFNVVVSDVDATPVVLDIVDIPSGAYFDRVAMSFIWLDVRPKGLYEVTFIAKDSLDPGIRSSMTVAIEITENDPPIIASPTQIDVALGDDVMFTVSASDLNQPAPTLSVKDIPENAEFDTVDGLFRWNKPPEGVYSIEFVATDGLDMALSARKTVTILVSDPASVIIDGEKPTPDAETKTTTGPGKRGVGFLNVPWALLLMFYTFIFLCLRYR